MQPEGRALVVTAQLEATVALLGRLVALDVRVLDDATELAHALDRRIDVIDREEDVGRRFAVAAVDPPRPSGVWIMKPLPEGPGSKRHPNRPS